MKTLLAIAIGLLVAGCASPVRLTGSTSAGWSAHTTLSKF
jgi:uncharacterized protein YceK